MTWIKICGTTNIEDALASVAAGANAVGFVFAPSPRQIDPEGAHSIVNKLPVEVEKIGVFVNETPERIVEVARYAGLTGAQLHGDETLEFTLRLGQACEGGGTHLRVFKAVAFNQESDGALREYAASETLDGILLDSASQDSDCPRGGTGRSFDWDQAAMSWRGLGPRTHLVLAGGLSPENVATAIRKLRPWGVDVCSGVERQPGKKDGDRLRAFVAAVRAAERP